MVLDIIKYGHPVLRQPGQRIERITPEIRQLAAHMIETMRAADGVGLAAHQVGRPLRLTVLDVTPSEQPWSMTPARPMPLVLVNPLITRHSGEQVGPEGCLSIPEVSATIRRAATVEVRAEDLDGQPLAFTATGLLARAVQHELDHLAGILFVDRMDAATRAAVAGKLKKLQKDTLAALEPSARRRRLPVSG